MATRGHAGRKAGPKRRNKHYSYNESVDEAGMLIDDEPVETEQSVPAEENEPVEGVEPEDDDQPAVFED